MILVHEFPHFALCYMVLLMEDILHHLGGMNPCIIMVQTTYQLVQDFVHQQYEFMWGEVISTGKSIEHIHNLYLKCNQFHLDTYSPVNLTECLIDGWLQASLSHTEVMIVLFFWLEDIYVCLKKNSLLLYQACPHWGSTAGWSLQFSFLLQPTRRGFANAPGGLARMFR